MKGNCSKATLLESTKNSLMIQLKIFKSDREGNTFKIFPNLVISQQIVSFSEFMLEGIIWHIGDKDVNNGHYIASIKKNGVWYNADDSNVVQYADFNLLNKNSSLQVPYILYHRKTKFSYPRFQKTENSYMKCLSDHNLHYEQPQCNESPKKRYVRLRKYECCLKNFENNAAKKSKTEEKKSATENSYRERLSVHNLCYQPPPLNESPKDRALRFQRFRRHLQKFEKTSN